MFQGKISTKFGNLAANIPNLERVDALLGTEIGKVAAQRPSALSRAHADAGGKSMHLLDREMLGDFLVWRMTVRFVWITDLE